MRNDFVTLFAKYRTADITLLVLVIITGWWISLHPFLPSSVDSVVRARYIWGSSYQVIALWGAVCGLFIGQLWGGTRSVIGRSIIAFSCGLLLQVFGQSVYSYYNLFAHIEAPYPSLGDIGYFGSIFAYLYGAFLLARASGVSVSLKSYRNQLLAVLLPILLLLTTYLIFLQGYVFDWAHPVKVFLDFGYPLGQACYVSVAILTLLLSRKVLGGMMRGAVLLLLIALIVQYCSDFNFLYQANQNSWYVAGYGDYLYVVSYFLMSIALMYIGHVFSKIRES
jgi:hypothetical protein